MSKYNKIKNIITFKIKTGYYLELITPEIVKLLGVTKSKMIKLENGINISYIENTKEVLIDFNVNKNNHQQNARVFYAFVPANSFDPLLDMSPLIILYF